MLSFLSRARKAIIRIGAVLSLGALAACDVPVAGGGGGPAIDTSAPLPVALLVPGGSGNASDELLARSLQNSARLAISDLGTTVRIDLRVYQTGGNPAQAQAMAIRAADEGARIILGPVFAQEANAVGVAMAPRGINVLAFSNNTDIAGGNVFVLGPTFRNTAERLANYAARQGKRRIMVVHDRTTAGEAGRAAIQAGVARSGATVVATQGYEFSQNGIAQAASGIATSARSSGADALFLTADTAGALPLVTQLLRDAGAGSQQFIGLTRWDIPAATLALPSVQGGWFALPDPSLYQQYQSRYQTAFGEAPHPIAGLAFDGIAAIGALVRNGQSNALTGAALTQNAGFVGVNGVFRLRGDGSNERGLAVATIRNNQLVILEPAPRSFSGAGF
jgi:ABC-type branched-subunit amino acid transport system substrate-binding protein